MATKVQKWGNSLAVRLPKELAENVAFEAGVEVEVIQKAGALVIRRSRRREPELRLEDLLAKITPENRRGEFDWGPPVGREIIEEW